MRKILLIMVVLIAIAVIAWFVVLPPHHTSTRHSGCDPAGVGRDDHRQSPIRFHAVQAPLGLRDHCRNQERPGDPDRGQFLRRSRKNWLRAWLRTRPASNRWTINSAWNQASNHQKPASAKVHESLIWRFALTCASGSRRARNSKTKTFRRKCGSGSSRSRGRWRRRSKKLELNKSRGVWRMWRTSLTTWPSPIPSAPQTETPGVSGAAAKDQELAKQVSFALFSERNNFADIGAIRAESKDGRVTLEGTVASRAERALAERIARQVSGVQSINNLLIVSGKVGA